MKHFQEHKNGFRKESAPFILSWKVCSTRWMELPLGNEDPGHWWGLTPQTDSTASFRLAPALRLAI